MNIMQDIEKTRDVAHQFFVHSPGDLSQSYVDWARKLKDEPGITYGCVLDKYIIPAHPGDVIAIVARPGHGKSSFMAYLARREAQRIARTGETDKVAVYVTWEQTVEEIESFFQSGREYSSSDLAWGRADMKAIISNAVKRPSLPIWMIGESKRHEGAKRPKMTINYVYAAIESMQERYEKKPSVLCLDYAQIMPTDGKRTKDQEVSEAILNAKQLAMRVGVPVFIGSQAGRGVDKYKDKLPNLSDCQWSSAIEQVSDKAISLWRPIKTESPEERPEITVGGTAYLNDENLFIIKLLKQRMDKGFGVWAIRFEPQTLTVTDYRKE